MSENSTDTAFRKAHKAFKTLNLFSLSLVLFSQIVASTVFPFIEVGVRQIKDLDPNLLNFIYMLHIVFVAYSVVGLVKIKEFIFSVGIDQIEQALKKTTEDLEFEKAKNDKLTALLGQLGAVQGGLSVLQEILSKHENGFADAQEVAGLLAPLVQLRAEVLNFTNSEMYNFSVYLVDKKGQKLHLFYRACDDRIERHDRPWKLGVGHVGVAFTRNEPIISVDASKEPDISGEFPLPTDKVYYASFICMPILGAGTPPREPIGVLVFTSSRAGHFSQAYRMVAESFSLILSSYFAVKKVPVLPLQQKSTTVGLSHAS